MEVTKSKCHLGLKLRGSHTDVLDEPVSCTMLSAYECSDNCGKK